MNKVLALCAALTLLVALVGCPKPTTTATAPAPTPPVSGPKGAPAAAPTSFSAGVTETDEPAPDFTLKDTAGNGVTKAEFSGKILILDFWATWCDSCVEKLKKYEPIFAKYKDQGVECLAVSLDSKPEVAAGWAKTTAFPYRIVMMDQTLQTAYFPEVSGSLKIPQARIIDRDGNLRYKFTSDSVVGDMELALSKLAGEKVGGDEAQTKEVTATPSAPKTPTRPAPSKAPASPAPPAKKGK